jgi:hypothetical protein
MSEPPRSHVVTHELLGPLSPFTVEDRASVFTAVAGIPRTLADLAVPRPGGASFRLTDHDVRTALAGPEHSAHAAPFAWSARTARRLLGLSAVRSVVAGETRSPVEGARAAMADMVRSAQQGERPPSPLDRWLIGLPGAGRAVVQAEAVTWATRLWCALEWSAFEDPPVIGRDHWWDSPHSSLLAIRSRAEVRSVALDQEGRPFSTHLVVLGGPRRGTIRSELSVVALVEALRATPSLPPGRIVGWWPDSGHLVKVEVDHAAVTSGVEAVARTLAGVDGNQAYQAPLPGAVRVAV